MIREIQPEDLSDAIALLEILRLSTPYRCVAPDWEHIINTVIACMNQTTGLVLVAEHDKKITGIMIATTRPIWWVNPKMGAKIASDLVFYSQRFGDGRRMLRRMVQWAFSVPRVVRIEMAVSSGQGSIDVMRRLYEREGFTLEGTLFVKNHPRYNEALIGQVAV